jgi:hypothetical protein
MQDFTTVLAQIQTAESTIFSVEFIKKDGSLRRMKCRLNVKKGVKGVGMSYNPIDKGLLPVFDMDKLAFRMININTITRLKIRKEQII